MKDAHTGFLSVNCVFYVFCVESRMISFTGSRRLRSCSADCPFLTASITKRVVMLPISQVENKEGIEKKWNDSYDMNKVKRWTTELERLFSQKQSQQQDLK